MFTKGNFVKGTDRKSSSAYSFTNSNLIKAEVLRTVGTHSMVIKVLEHKNRSVIGNVYHVEQRYFEQYEEDFKLDGVKVNVTDKDIVFDKVSDKKVITIKEELFIALPSHAVYGMSSKHDNDTFDKEIGKSLAYYRYLQNRK